MEMGVAIGGGEATDLAMDRSGGRANHNSDRDGQSESTAAGTVGNDQRSAPTWIGFQRWSCARNVVRIRPADRSIQSNCFRWAGNLRRRYARGGARGDVAAYWKHRDGACQHDCTA